MYVCVCFAVSQSEVEQAIGQGAHTTEAVTRACKAGGDCGACQGMIHTMIEDHLDCDGSGVRRPAVAATSADGLVPEHALVRTRAA
jgi:bacterioferritin-associated ferredoxin